MTRKQKIAIVLSCVVSMAGGVETLHAREIAHLVPSYCPGTGGFTCGNPFVLMYNDAESCGSPWPSWNCRTQALAESCDEHFDHSGAAYCTGGSACNSDTALVCIPD